jgi:hypothetical protein
MRQPDPQAVTTPGTFAKWSQGRFAANANKETKRRGAASAKRKRIAITRRDDEIVHWVRSVGVATREQVQKVFFGPAARSRCQHRLTLLFRERYLDRYPDRTRNRPDVYFISRRSVNGVRLLRANGVTDPIPKKRVSSLRLQHTLDLVSCRAQVTRACRESGATLETWLSADELFKEMAPTGLLPDTFFRLCRGAAGSEKRSSFFLEVERSDKTERTLSEKFRRYGDFFYHGAFERKFRARALRVLVLIGSDYGITPEHRVAKLAALAERERVTFLHFAALPAFLALPPSDVLLEPIWRRPSSQELVPLFSDKASNHSSAYETSLNPTAPPPALTS